MYTPCVPIQAANILGLGVEQFTVVSLANVISLGCINGKGSPLNASLDEHD